MYFTQQLLHSSHPNGHNFLGHPADHFFSSCSYMSFDHTNSLVLKLTLCLVKLDKVWFKVH